MFIYNIYKLFIHITYIYCYLKMLHLSFIIQLCYLYTLDIISLSDTYFEKACLPLCRSFYFINDIIDNTPCCQFSSFHLCSSSTRHENYWTCLTRTISQSTFNSVATASIFSLHTEPRLVIPLSQYFLRVAKSLSLNWVRSWS